MPKYVKFKRMWWEYDETTPIDKATIIEACWGNSRAYNNFDLTEFELVEAKKPTDLDWNNTLVLDDRFKTGWLSPDGIFYGCDYVMHTTQAAYVHKTGRYELEKKGFIHISLYGNKFFSKLKASFSGNAHDRNMKPTDAQMKYLAERPYIDSKEVQDAYFNEPRYNTLSDDDLKDLMK